MAYRDSKHEIWSGIVIVTPACQQTESGGGGGEGGGTEVIFCNRRHRTVLSVVAKA